MAISNEKRLLLENQRLRARLAEYGLHPAERRVDETLADENHRLLDELRWYLGLLSGV